MAHYYQNPYNKPRGNTMDIKNIKIGFIGGGAMAESILRGVLHAGIVSADKITVSEIHQQRCRQLQDQFHIETAPDNKTLVKNADMVVLAVKPQSIQEVLEEISSVADTSTLFVSIAAGIQTGDISLGLGETGRIVRVMPNTPAKVGAGASALCAGPGAHEEDLSAARLLFDAVGATVIINEALMDAVTGLSGSGPAYVFLFIEALADAGVKAGLPRDTAVKLAAQTCFGAAKLVLETEEHPGRLKDQVTSPAGTTIAGVQALEQGSFRGTVMCAVEAAVARSKELGT